MKNTIRKTLALLVLAAIPATTGCAANMDATGAASPSRLSPTPAAAMANVPTDVPIPNVEVYIPSTPTPNLPTSGPTERLPSHVASPRVKPMMQCWVCN